MGIRRKIFHPRCGFADRLYIFLQRFHPLQGLDLERFTFLQRFHPRCWFSTNVILPKEALQRWLISNGGKMERMPLTRAMGLALECFLNIIPSKGMIFRKIFPTSRHSFHVCWIVRKAILNEPKVFGYFWAPKVTIELGSVSSFVGLVTVGLQK